MRKKIPANCKGCKACAGYMICALGYEIKEGNFREQVPSVLCPKPTTDKAMKREEARRDQASDS